MATCFLAPDPIQSTFFIPGSNTPGNGAQVGFFANLSSTPATVYKDPLGATPWTNPIVLDSGGNLPSGGEVWFLTGQVYTVKWAPANDVFPPASPYRTMDNLSGVNDITGSQSEWVLGTTPTFISASSFSVAGDQTAIYQIGRRVKTVNSGGTVYGTITNSVFTTLTTVTIQTDSSVLDAGLSAVSYGLISAINTSEPGTHGSIAFYTSTQAGLTTTWTSPTALAFISGAGGGGAGGSPGLSKGVGAGGGSGAVTIKQQVTLVPLTIYTIKLGAGGTGTQAAGNNGSSTVMSSAATTVVSLGGGTGGAFVTGGIVAGGASGAFGQAGGPGYATGTFSSTSAMQGGDGGGTPWGPGGVGGFSIFDVANPAAPTAGQRGSGSGGVADGLGINITGVSGGSGILIIEW